MTDELLLIIDNNQGAFNDTLKTVKIGGDIAGFCYNQLIFQPYLSKVEQITILKWFHKLDALPHQHYLEYWESVKQHYQNKLIESGQ